MKIALAHDYLNQYGGAERVLETLIKIFPEAPVFTLLHDSEKTLNRFRDKIKKTSFLNHFPLAKKYHRLFIPLMPLASRSIKIDGFDLVISSTAGFAKGFNVKNSYHISYCHTPLRYAWEEDYLTSKLPKLTRKGGLLINPLLKRLKEWDFAAAQKPDLLIANSNFIARKIKKYYGREAEVIYPPVSSNFYYEPEAKKEKYFLAIGRFLHYKRFDLIIKAFNELKLPLKIIGSGPEYKNLKILNKSPNTAFFDFVADENELRKIYNQAQALIFPQIEDFGLVAAEAQVSGLPVIAYKEGGAKEIVQDKLTGLFFENQTPENLIQKIKEFREIAFDRLLIAESAKKFSEAIFKDKILNAVERLKLGSEGEIER